MKIKYSNRQGEVITRDIQPGTALVGIRVLEFIVESYEEHQILLSDRGYNWFKRNVNFRVTPRTVKPVEKESNYGSDWVDDGV
jgi:hypothetical protein